MKKLFILCLIIFCSCNSTNKEGKDRKVFDSFIGVSKEEIIATFGSQYHFNYEKIYDDDDNIIRSIYLYKYRKFDFINDDYAKYNKPIYMSTSTRSFYIFNFFNEVTFIIKDNYCIDYSAY